MREKTKRNFGTLFFLLGGAGILWGVHEFPREYEVPNKRMFEETYPVKPIKIIGASAVVLMAGAGLLNSYKRRIELEERNEYFAEGEKDYIEYHNLE